MRWLCVFLLTVLTGYHTKGQSVMTVFKKSSLIIPMDNAKQNLSAASAFNVKAYGLVNELLQNNIPVKWIIQDGKGKDAADFSVLSSRIYPTTATASSLSYSAGPFIIDSIWVAKATPFILAYGNSVAVYKAEAGFSAPVRYELTTKPKIAVLTNGNSHGIHTKALRLAGFTSPAHFDSLQTTALNGPGMCYTFATEPHWAGPATHPATNHVTVFLNSGGNFFAQCAGIDTYDDLQHYHTTNGIEYETNSTHQDNVNLYLLNSHPLLQFDGILTNAPTGTVVNYKNDGGNYQPSTQILVKKNDTPTSGSAEGDVVASWRKTGPAATGGNVTYLGGHDYLKATTDVGSELIRAGDVTWNNGLRIFYNAIFMPSARPASCNFSFQAEVSLASSVSSAQPCVGSTLNYTVTINNTGPGTANDVLVKSVIPPGLTFVSASATQGTYNSGTGMWTVGDISPGITCNLVLSYTVTGSGSYQLKSFNADLIAGNSFANDTVISNFATESTPPTITPPSNINTTTNTGCTRTGLSLGTPVTADNCGVASVTNNAPSVFPLGSTTVTWTVTDNAGNTATATQTITVTDEEDPTIAAPSNISTTTNTGCTRTGLSLGTPVTTDNCGVASVTNNAPSVFPLGSTTVTWTVTDNAGNTASATQTITVTDEEDPTIAAPSNINTTTNTGCTRTGLSLGTPVTADNCGVASVTNNAPSVFPLGSTTVTWTVTDNAGNTAAATQTITVTDEEDPTITAPSDINTTPDSGCTATGVSLGTPATADNCGVASVTNNAPSVFPSGSTVVTWTVTDNAGNTASATQTITVSDNEDPTITAPADITVSADSGCEATGINLGTPATADNCGVASVTSNAPSVFPLGSTTVTWTVTDNAGNSASATQTVTVADNTDPVFAQTADTTYSCVPTVVFPLPGVTDNCGVLSLEQTDGTGLQSGSDFPVGITELQFTATDAAGNTSVYQKYIYVIEPPQNAYAGEDTLIYSSETALEAALEENQSGIWAVLSGGGQIADHTSPSTVVTHLSTGENMLSWTISDHGCGGDSDTIRIQVREIIIPNGFSPDGDGYNDVFEITGLEEYAPVEFTVLNAWGSEIYRSSDYKNDWNGKNMLGNDLGADTYYYQLKLNDQSVFTGFIILKRK